MSDDLGGPSRDDVLMTTGISYRKARAGWLVPAALILLSVVPMLAGSLRLAELANGAEVTAENARFFAVPLPVVLHILAAGPFCVLGALQFARGKRRRHRVTGRLIVPCGLVVALSGLWMTLFYPTPDGVLLVVLRLVFGSAMAVSLVLGFAAIRRRDIARHRAWMIRGYAIALGAGTQVLTQLPWALAAGPPSGLTRELLLGAGWVVNLAVAEWIIRRRPVPAAAHAGRPTPSVVEAR
jgi:uncharacterized membrane protein